MERPRPDAAHGKGPPAICSLPLNDQKYLVTIDRDCRSIFMVDPRRGECAVVAELDQRLDEGLEGSLTPDARKWNRGLKSIRAIPEGFIVCDIFGVYQLDRHFAIRRYISNPQFTDIHTAFPCKGGMIVSNTGVDQVLWVDWHGHVTGRLDLHRWFPATPWMAHDLALVREQWGGDLRHMPLDWARESCHLNWAEETPLGTMLSCFIQGEILFFREGRPVRRIPARGKLHAPRYLAATGTFLFCASEDHRVVEIDQNGREVWSMEGFRFPKMADVTARGTMIVADTGGRRVCEVDRASHEIIWECPMPGTPYDIQPWEARA